MKEYIEDFKKISYFKKHQESLNKSMKKAMPYLLGISTEEYRIMEYEFDLPPVLNIYNLDEYSLETLELIHTDIDKYIASISR